MKILPKQLSKDEILSFLQKVDSSFIPFPLSYRIELKSYAEKLANNAVHFSIEEDVRLIGLCCCYMNDLKKQKVYISIICVDPDFAEKGIGKALMKNLYDHAKIKKFKVLELEVNIENTRAIKLYKSIGFNIERKENDAFFMIKAIL